jgi:hypothetical protein
MRDVALAADKDLDPEKRKEVDPRIVATVLRLYTSVETRAYEWEFAISPHLAVCRRGLSF